MDNQKEEPGLIDSQNSCDMFDSQFFGSPTSPNTQFGLKLSPSGKEASSSSGKAGIEDMLRMDFKIGKGSDEESSDDDEEKLGKRDQDDVETSEVNRMPVKHEVVVESSPMTIAEEKDEGEVGTEIEVEKLIEKVRNGSRKRKKLLAEIKEVDESISNFQENKRMRSNRMEVLASQVTKVEAELFRYTEASQEKKEGENSKKKDGNLLETKKMNEKMVDATKLVKTMEENVIRLVLGKKNDASENSTLEKLRESEKNIIAFLPGTVENQPGNIKSELEKLDNFKIVSCEDDSIKKMAGAIKKYEASQDKKGEVGVFIVKLGEAVRTLDDPVIKLNINKMMDQLKLIIKRGQEKFEDHIIVIPPAQQENWKAARVLEEEIKRGGYKIVNLLEEQMQKGLSKKEEDEVWEQGGLVFDKKYNDGSSGCLNEYAFRRCLDRVTQLMDGSDTPWCEVCGFTHTPGECLLDTSTKEMN